MNLAIRILVTLNIFLVSCCVVGLIPNKAVSYELEPYYNKAMKVITDNCNPGEYREPSQVDVEFTRDFGDYTTIGMCTDFYHRYKIEVLKQFWRAAPEKMRYQLMFHEVAHCALGLNHSQDPNNYMYFQIQDNMTYDTLYNQFLNDVLVTCSQHRKH